MPHLLKPARHLGLVACALWSLSGRARADDPYAWVMPSAEEQLARDLTEIPIGQGALFIPTLTGAEHEPPATVVTDTEVLSVSVGVRYLLPPGPYVVVLSSGSPAQGVGLSVLVEEGETTLVPVRWGALQIEVTDDHRIPHRGSYEIIRADTREPVGTGFGADTLQGEILQTWLLPPGLYRISRPGRGYRTLTDYTTVQVPEAGFVRYRLVMDPDSGDFLGSGVLLPDDVATSAEGRGRGRWHKSLAVGADGAMVRNQNVVGVFNQTQYTATGFVDGQAIFSGDPHRVNMLLQVEEGLNQIRPQEDDPLPLVKATDRLRGDALYTYALKKATGPYVRGSAQTQAFPTTVLVTDDTEFVVRSSDGEVIRSETVSANDTFRLADGWQPTLLREGAGINTTFSRKNRSRNFNFRFGYGMRQSLYGGALVLDDRTRTSAVEYSTVDTFYERGIEATVVASVRLPGWVVYSTDIEIFADFGSFTQPWLKSEVGIPYPPWALSWRNTLSLRLTRNLSLNYFANIDIEPQVIDKPQVTQSLLLRASWSVL